MGRDRAQPGKDGFGIRGRRGISIGSGLHLHGGRCAAGVELGLGLDVVEPCRGTRRLRRRREGQAGDVDGFAHGFGLVGVLETLRLHVAPVLGGGVVEGWSFVRCPGFGSGPAIERHSRQASRPDLGLDLGDGGLRKRGDTQPGPLGRGGRPGPGLDQVLDPAVQSLAEDAERFQEALADLPEMLHLDLVLLTLRGQVGQDPLPDVASLQNHVPALLAALLDGGRSGRPGLADDAGVLLFGALDPLLGRVAGRLEDPGRLVAQSLRHPASLEHLHRSGLQLRYPVRQRADQGVQPADLLGGLPQPSADRPGLVAAAYRGKVGLLHR